MSTFTTISPNTLQAIQTEKFASNEELDNITERSHEAFLKWKKVSLEERIKVVKQFIEAFRAQEEEVAKDIATTMGRPIRYCKGEVDTTIKRIETFIEIAQRKLKAFTTYGGDGDQFHMFIQRVPIGSVLLITPWNFPFLTSVNGVIPNILAGNSVILKSSPQTPNVGKIYDLAFSKTDILKGVFQYVHLDEYGVERCIKNESIKFVNFTGSVKNGRLVKKLCGERLINCCLELGGKDAAYVRPDIDVNFATEELVDGAIFNNGQSCCSIERIYVHESVYDQFTQKFAQLAQNYKLGDALDDQTTLGPLVSKHQAEFVRGQIKEAISLGAKDLIDHSIFPLDKPGSNYLSPHVLVDVDHRMSFMRDESFAPVVGIMKVKSDTEAIELMNDSEFGLTLSVWTEDESKFLEIAQTLDTGTVFMNRCDYPHPSLAWVGVKNSGLGCTMGEVGFEGITRPMSFHLKRKV
jgi:acyl-CoA reductase-like NAD-dependent aldehyde dehydrogenase